MGKFLFSLILIYSINPIFPTHFGDSTRFLHVQDENESNKPLVIKNSDLGLAEVISQRYKRDLSPDRSENLRNISTKVKQKEIQTKAPFFLISKVWKKIFFYMRHFQLISFGLRQLFFGLASKEFKKNPKEKSSSDDVSGIIFFVLLAD